MEVETIEADSKDLAEILKRATSGHEIIFESDVGEDGDNEEVEEIVEIIEEIEEVEEEVEELEETEEPQGPQQTREAEDGDDDEIDEHMSLNLSETEVHEHKDDGSSSEKHTGHGDAKISQSRSNYVKKQLKHHFKNGGDKGRSKQVVAYDVDEDWEDEDMDQIQHRSESNQTRSSSRNPSNNDLEDEDSSHVAQNGRRQQSASQSSKFRNQRQQSSADENTNEYWDEEEQESIVGYEDDQSGSQNEENVDSQHEIVKNAENNLVYTVLGSKKQNTSSRRGQEERYEGSRYVKMEQPDENQTGATIYYENEDMETMYVAQSGGEGDHYQYNNVIIGDQETRDSNREEQEEEREEESQEQIFLHEDEDGQLYFKDENGKLQPVFLTADGNYAIAENNSDDQDSQDQVQQAGKPRQPEGGAVLIPGMDYSPVAATAKTAAVPASATQEIDNEDNTVTISLIISEDENGQKRTQVIIPTTDNLKCETCNKSFKTSFQLLRHNRLKHAREEELSSRNYPCDLCPKRYPDQTSLARHRKTHTGDRPFQCVECHKTFPSSTALRRHLTLHNPQSRPVPCIYCDRRFLDKASLAKHEQSHLAGEHRTHTCDICHKAFMHSSDLALHKKNHDPMRKFDCEVCGREFNRLNNLQRHMMVHQQQGNDEALSCDVCGITYKFMSSLTRHMVTTHVNPEKMRQQAEEQRRKRENNYRRYMENRKMFEGQPTSGYSNKRSSFHHNTVAMSMQMSDNDDDA